MTAQWEYKVLTNKLRWKGSHYDQLERDLSGVEQASLEFDMPRSPLALIGVGTIFEEGILIEVEVTAAFNRVDSLPNADGRA